MIAAAIVLFGTLPFAVPMVVQLAQWVRSAR